MELMKKIFIAVMENLNEKNRNHRIKRDRNKMRNPGVYKVSNLEKLNDDQREKNGKWIPARPLSLYGFQPFTNFKIAFYVLIGKYDALDWEEEK